MLNVIVGSLTVPLLAIAVTRFVSRWEAVAAGLLLAINPFHLALSSLAIEVPFQILFGTAALAFASRLPGGGRPALFGCAATLGLGFMCSESTALILVAWLGVALLDPARLAGLKARDFAVATGIGLVIVAQDLHYNLTADTADFYYVNYLDHLGRIGSLSFGLHGLGFFLRDVFVQLQEIPSWLWVDDRGEYLGPGVVLGTFLLLGWLGSFRRGGDPSGGLLSWPVHVFVLVTTFGGEVVRSTMLDSATWAWPQAIIPYASALAAHLAFRTRLPPWLVLGAVILAMLIESPPGVP